MTAEVGTPEAWVLTGMSGAGKATAARALEAAGVDVADNLASLPLCPLGPPRPEGVSRRRWSMRARARPSPP